MLSFSMVCVGSAYVMLVGIKGCRVVDGNRDWPCCRVVESEVESESDDWNGKDFN